MLQMDLSRILLCIQHYSMYSQTIRQVFTQHCCFFSRGSTKMSSSQPKGSGRSAGLCLWLLYSTVSITVPSGRFTFYLCNPTFSHSCLIFVQEPQNIRWLLSNVGCLACANDESEALRSLAAKWRHRKLLWDSRKVAGGGGHHFLIWELFGSIIWERFPISRSTLFQSAGWNMNIVPVLSLVSTFIRWFPFTAA